MNANLPAGNEPVLQLTSRGAIAPPSHGRVAALADQFRVKHCARLPALIESHLLARIQEQIGDAMFVERVHGSIASELCMERNACLGLLHFLVNDPVVFRSVERITGRGPLAFFAGRVYRREPAGQHHDSWHSDVHPDRQVGLSINLSRSAYGGGVFEIREEDADSVLASIANVGAGDAILFSVADGLEHRVTDVSGAIPKTAFAGWFGATHDYLADFRRDRSQYEEM